MPHEAGRDVAAVPVPHGPHASKVIAVKRGDRREAVVAVEPAHLAVGESLDAA
jgi:maltooligosyltrehalose synthase